MLKSGTMTSEKLLEEAKKMHKLRHDKVVTLIAVCSIGDPIYIITEFMENGSLVDFLRSEANRPYLRLPGINNILGQVKGSKM